MHASLILSIQGLKHLIRNLPQCNSHKISNISVIVIILSRKFYLGPGFQQNWPDLYSFIHNSFNNGFRAY